MARVLVVDDEELIRWSLAEELSAAGYKTSSAEGVAEALRLVEKEVPDVVLTDLRIGAESGLDLLKAVRRDHPGVAVVLMTGFADLASAVEALREGAADYISKPLQLAGLKITLERVMETVTLRTRLKEAQRKRRGKYNFDSVVAESPSMKEAMSMARKIAASPQGNVLLLGESGCGKDRLARAIHYESPRAEAPFVEVSCTSIPEHLLESELFGYEKGAFTGAAQQKKGLFESANGGTVFLNEIGHMPGGLQGKVLRIIEDKTFKRVGGVEDVVVDVRVIAATNEDLEKAVAEGHFRTDLFYRINVLAIRLRPLRERPEDVLPLAERLLGLLSRDFQKPGRSLSAAEKAALAGYSWPGNVRELRNTLERMLILGELSLPSLRGMSQPTAALEAPAAGFKLPMEGVRLDDVEKSLVSQAIDRSGGNQQKASLLLGLSRDALRRRLEKFGLRAAALLAALSLWTGSQAADRPKPDDPFRAAHASEAAGFLVDAVVHSPVREGACTACHDDPRDPKKLKAPEKELCLTCHKPQGAELAFEPGHMPFKDGECSGCHRPHSSAQRALLSDAPNALCAGCHDAAEAGLSKAHGGVTVFSGECAVCHRPHGSGLAKLLPKTGAHPPFSDGACAACHDEPGKGGRAAPKAALAEVCCSCHDGIRGQAERAVSHPPAMGGDCAGCHQPHASRTRKLLRAKPADLCRSCHKDVQPVGHPAVDHPSFKDGAVAKGRPGRSFDCTACHLPHGSPHKKLLTAEWGTLCESCHQQ
jgi:predicted CXXCH cytochrome family protein